MARKQNGDGTVGVAGEQRRGGAGEKRVGVAGEQEKRMGVAGEERRGGVWWGRRVAQCLVLLFSTGIGLTRVLISSHFIHQVSFRVPVHKAWGCPY